MAHTCSQLDCTENASVAYDWLGAGRQYACPKDEPKVRQVADALGLKITFTAIMFEEAIEAYEKLKEPV